MSKQALRLFFFGGFYESIHDSVFDSEEESILEDYGGKSGMISDGRLIMNNTVKSMSLQSPVKLGLN